MPAILFDLFGVIGLPQTPEARERLVAIAGVEPGRFWEAYWALRRPYDAGQTGVDYWAAVAERLGVRFGDETVARLIAADLESWSGADPVMVGLVGDLAAEGRTLGLLSNIIEELVPVFEARHRTWLAHFTALTYSCEIGVAKPDHRAYTIAAARLGVQPRDCVFIDDTEANVLAAREVGMRAEVFHSPAQARELLSA
jgi:putative hydrolase of the HAD superfamily